MTASSPITFESNYFFPQVFAVKALIYQQETPSTSQPSPLPHFLFLTEPETSSWKPGRLGLPGGKSDPGEDWLATLHREIREELDIQVIPQGIFSIEEIVLLNPKTGRKQLTHHLIVLCTLKDPNTQLAQNARWYSLDELHHKNVDDLTEYYFPHLFTKIASGNLTEKLMPLDFIHVMNGINNTSFQDWLVK